MIDDDLQPMGCCIGEAALGRCTCWTTEYDQPQADLQPGPVEVRADGLCKGCAYRPGSPERRAVEGYATEDDLVDLGHGAGLFFCHEGMRRAVGQVHPEGVRLAAAGEEDYQPPVKDAVAYQADGTPAALCAGWAAHVRAVGLDPLELVAAAQRKALAARGGQR